MGTAQRRLRRANGVGVGLSEGRMRLSVHCRGALCARQRPTRVRCGGAGVRNVLPYGRTACPCDGLTAGQVGRAEMGGHAFRGINEVAVPVSPVGRVQGHRQDCEDGPKQGVQPALEVAESGLPRIGEVEKPSRHRRHAQGAGKLRGL